MKIRIFLTTLVMVAFFAIGVLAISQSSSGIEVPPNQELSTQAEGVCFGTLCDRVLIERVYLNTSGYLLISTAGTETSLTCTPASSIYLRVNSSAENYKEIYTMALAARLNGQTITLQMDPAITNACIIKSAYL